MPSLPSLQNGGTMTRILSKIVAIALACAVAAPAAAAQVSAVTSVNVIKPVSLTKLQDLDLGTLTFSSFTGTRTIVLSDDRHRQLSIMPPPDQPTAADRSRGRFALAPAATIGRRG